MDSKYLIAKNPKNYFYWSIVAVQRCVSFGCTTTWISSMHHIYPASWTFLLTIPIPPPRSSQRTELSSCAIGQLPTSYLFYTWYWYDNANLPVIPPSLPHPPCVHTSILYVCISILALQIGLAVPFLRLHIYVLMYFSLSVEFNEKGEAMWKTDRALRIKRPGF